MNNLNNIINEGKAVIEFRDTEVFYNPVQEFNRDLSIAVISSFIKKNPLNTKVKIAEALSATGLRAIRYALEIDGLHSIVANDIDSNACNFIRSNIHGNKVTDKVFVNNDDAK